MSPPILSAHFVPFVPPIASLESSTWVDAAASQPVARQRKPRRPVTASVVAWRSRYYAFRHARDRILTGRIDDARTILAGEHGSYIRRKLADLARRDGRIRLDSVDRPNAEPPAVVVPLSPPREISERTLPPRLSARQLPARPPVPVPAREASPSSNQAISDHWDSEACRLACALSPMVIGQLTLDAHRQRMAFDDHLATASAQSRRRFALSLVNANPGDPAHAARLAIIAAAGIDAARLWLAAQIGAGVDFAL